VKKYRILIPISRYFEILIPNTEPTKNIEKNTEKPTPTSNTDCSVLCGDSDNRQLANCLIYARALLEYVIFILWMRSVSKMLPSVKFAEDKVLTFLILREKCWNCATLSLT